MIVFNIGIFAVAILVLFYSGGLMVRALTVMGRFLHVSEFSLSFVMAAFATSLPEFFVGLNSAIQGTPTLSLGNVVGANVLNATAVLGVAAVLAGKLDINHIIKKEDFQFTFGLLLFPVLLILDGVLSRYDGLILLFLFGGYLIYLRDQERITPPVDGIGAESLAWRVFINNLGMFFWGTALLLASSYLVVTKSIAISQIFSLPLFFIGILVAIGTTLPEITFSLRSVAMGYRSMAFGNALGSIMVNLTLIAGMVATVRPMEIVDTSRVLIGLLATAALVIFIQLVLFVRGYISRSVGIALLGVAFLFMALEAFLSL